MKLPWQIKSKKRGAGILTVLTASTLLLLLGLTVAGTSFHHLSISNRLHHSQKARNLAEACLAKSLASVLAHPTNFTPYSPHLKIEDNASTDNGCGWLTFQASEVPNLNAKFKNSNLVQSYNNIANDNPVTIPATTITIPKHSLYLRAVGSAHGVERCMECVVWVPPFPYSIASGGQLYLGGDSKIASVDNPADKGDPSKYLPGSLVTNSTDSSGALKIEGSNVFISGDVQAAGGADISSDTIIKGERRLFAPPVYIPTLDINSYNTMGKTGVQTYSSSTGPDQVEGYAYRSGALNFNNGIQLDGGVVYVDGDLTINGPISGEGALIATGKLTMNGTGSLSSNNNVALLSGSDMTLSGSASSHISVSGLLYSQGNLKAEYADISGNAAAPQSSSEVNFNNVNLIKNNSQESISFTTGGKVALPSVFESTKLDIPITAISLSPPPGPLASINLKDLDLAVKIKGSPADDRFKDSATNEYHLPINYQSKDSSGNTMARDKDGNHLPPGIYETVHDASQSNSYYARPITTTVAPLDLNDLEITFNDGSNLYTGATALSKASEFAKAKLQTDAHRVLTTAEEAVIDAQLTDYLDQDRLIDYGLLGKAYGPTTETELYRISAAYIHYNLHKNDPAGEQVTITLNPGFSNGNFINLADRVRLLYWREVAQ